MRGSIPVGRILGIGIRIHFTFPLVLVFFGLWAANKLGFGPGSLAAAVYCVANVVALFACILLHELGHSVVSILLGYRVADITLLPVGGVARMVDLPRKPLQELAIAIAGPAVTFFLAGVSLVLMVLLRAPMELDLMRPLFVTNLFWLNLSLGMFNLLPAFPMDGGRILRATLALLFSYVTATRVASVVGQIGGALMVLFGLKTASPLLALVGFFVFWMAGVERRMVIARERLQGLAVRNAMVPVFDTISVTDPVGEALRRSRESFQEDFPVRDRDGRIVGLLSAARLREAMLRPEAAATSVGEILPGTPRIFTPELPLVEAFKRFQGGGDSAGLVVEDGRVIGVVTLDRILKAS